MEYLIIGCGLTGSVIARHLADQGHQVSILERRNHIGGNMYDYVDDNGISVHQYGPHVFHTVNESLKDYMLIYGTWRDFSITCQVQMMGKITPSPFNYKTIDDYYAPKDAATLKTALERAYPGRKTATIVELLENSNPIIRKYADFLFAHDYSLYTAKQWGMQPSEIDPSVLKRVPVRFSYEDGYFDDPWQMVPVDGYTAWFERLLDHPNIQVELNMDALSRLNVKPNQGEIWLDGKLCSQTVIYTGAIDELFHMKFGPLPYRSLRFEWKTEPVRLYQGAALVACPEAKDFTRITEYNHFPQKNSQGEVTSLAYEFPVMYQEGSHVEPYYPILTEDSQRCHAKYMELVKRLPNLICCGRLANFKYYNMDQALAAALAICYHRLS